ncbi:uncharacterized protein LOC120352807 [Nilaparvata lugens]|uniref:uncharacterized protein LOC120352807 n=1 Tax=Nilaparvata lugens TaxID=108931 RepID=UPI00193D3422|nr:uncharacterized protein LOC120352807 [Nilaparvata lugens]
MELISFSLFIVFRLKPKSVFAFFRSLGIVLQTDEDYNKLSNFHGTIQGNYAEELKQVVNATLKQIRKNQDWIQTYAPLIMRFYEKDSSSTVNPTSGGTSTSKPPATVSTSTSSSPTNTTTKPTSASWINKPSLLVIFMVALVTYRAQLRLF